MLDGPASYTLLAPTNAAFEAVNDRAMPLLEPEHRPVLIAILRNPISRAYANWRMEQLKGRDQGPLPLSWPEEEHRCRDALPLQHRVPAGPVPPLYTNDVQLLTATWHALEDLQRQGVRSL